MTTEAEILRVAREAAASGVGGGGYYSKAGILSGFHDDVVEVRFAILGARAMQEAMSAQGGGEVEPAAWRWSQRMHDSMGGWEQKHEVHPPGSYVKNEDVRDLTPLYARPAPEVKDAPGVVPCERCQGNGEIVTDWDRYIHSQPGDAGDEGTAECPDCNGTGEVTTTPAPAASDELVERLRREGAHIRDKHRHVKAFYAMEEAASRIEANAAEMERKDARIAELERDNRDLQKIADELGCAVQAHADEEARATAAEAERDALREALQKIAVNEVEVFDRDAGHTVVVSMDPEEMADIARAALRPEAKGGRDEAL